MPPAGRIRASTANGQVSVNRRAVRKTAETYFAGLALADKLSILALGGRPQSTISSGDRLGPIFASFTELQRRAALYHWSEAKNVQPPSHILLTAQQLAKLRRAFTEHDADCSGDIDVNELDPVCDALSVERVSEQELFELGNARLDFEDVVKFYLSRQHGPVPKGAAEEEQDKSNTLSASAAPVLGGASVAAKHTPAAGTSLSHDLSMGQCLNDQQIAELKAVFLSLDVDETGQLSLQQAESLWTLTCPEMTAEQVHAEVLRLWADLDAQLEDTITFGQLEEYLRWSEDDIGALLHNGRVRARPTTTREWVWAVVDHKTGNSYQQMPRLRTASTAFMVTVQLLIVASVVVMLVESMPSFQRRGDGSEADLQVDSGNDVTLAIESICIAVFTIELLLRTVSTPEMLSYASSPYTLIDLVAILPFWLWVWLGQPNQNDSTLDPNSLVVLRVVRLVKIARITRVLKLGRHSEGVQLMLVALKRSRIALTWLLVLLILAMCFFASLLWHVEKVESKFVFDIGKRGQGAWVRDHDSAYPDRGQELAFQSIPDTMWWAIVTLTTVGYGDVTPVTEGGKVVGGLCMLCGLLVVAYPTTLLCNVFSTAYQEYEDKRRLQARRLELLGGVAVGNTSPARDAAPVHDEEWCRQATQPSTFEDDTSTLGLSSRHGSRLGSVGVAPESPDNSAMSTAVLRQFRTQVPSGDTQWLQQQLAEVVSAIRLSELRLQERVTRLEELLKPPCL
eukprot:TRINITY_DN15728_c0_g1_i1.p1 TRINITY_DN15728_c0_g1~~TRINITY_DN15728_c0_g1_i1.p1  ORF type:complete len:755 (+),score=255.58 TRINITY_DN15728_c0_g1_i1:55-2265(+)